MIGTGLPAPRDVFTGFGDEPATSIKFQLLKNRDGSDPAWGGGEPSASRFRVLHSNDVISQYGGRGERVMAARLLFADAADMERLDLVVGRQATLRYGWGITTRIEGQAETLPDGVRYLVLPGTELESLTGQTRYRGGQATATATFRRAVGVGTLYDYAHYAEDE